MDQFETTDSKRGASGLDAKDQHDRGKCLREATITDTEDDTLHKIQCIIILRLMLTFSHVPQTTDLYSVNIRAYPAERQQQPQTYMTEAILPLFLGCLASIATIAGGMIALRLHGRLSLILGLSGGIVLGVALLDLIPEALHLSQPVQPPWFVFLVAAIGMLAYLAAGRLISMLPGSGRRLRGHLAPASLTLHSFIDGCGIGLAFQLSPAVGWSVAVAILSHDVADGVNIVGLSLASHSRSAARRWLALNGVAPLLGAAVGQLITIPRIALVQLLAGLAGVFLCIAVSELLPKSYRMKRRLTTIVSCTGGVAIIYFGTLLHI